MDFHVAATWCRWKLLVSLLILLAISTIVLCTRYFILHVLCTCLLSSTKIESKTNFSSGRTGGPVPVYLVYRLLIAWRMRIACEVRKNKQIIINLFIDKINSKNLPVRYRGTGIVSWKNDFGLQWYRALLLALASLLATNPSFHWIYQYIWCKKP